jgi:phosphoglycerate dehydrogenase-like enzyme
MVKVWIPHPHGLDLVGELPPGVQLEVYPGGDDMPSDPADVRFLVPGFLSDGASAPVMARFPRLAVIQLLSAGADAWVGRVPSGVVLCDAAGVHTSSTAEWAMTAMLAAVREFPRFIRAQAEHRWDYTPTDELAGKRVLVVGAGTIGEGLCRRLEPFDVELVRVARRARPGVHAVAELPALLPDADIVVLIVPLTPATRGMVDKDFLSRMADGALLVNAARGPVVRTDDLVVELMSGRLRAALDVTDPEPLPPDHPLWDAPGLLLTPHVAGSVAGLAPRAYGLVGEQLRRYAAGQELLNVVVDGY